MNPVTGRISSQPATARSKKKGVRGPWLRSHSMHNQLTRSAATLIAVGLGISLTGCFGKSIEGTYLGSAGNTVLLLKSGGKCGYSEDYKEEEGVQIEVQEGCQWSSSDKNFTLVRSSESRALTGSINDDGTISIPDQTKWHGEIYTKKK
ncbi:hypothetical protein [Propionibacterium sp. oral taxon 192]|uniref:hypothetical protein n=1 Tax=Propionibacterium sp. oral taxon 192 TaxID=671222 RepID=UPI0012EC4664|nr:hypothetical protein [Propionibacterium sp. oral taxon 192]